MGQELPDCYEILQVSRRADPIIITRAYRLLATIYHPDNKETGDEEKFREVVDAYRELVDPVRRAAYDRATFDGVGSYSARPTGNETAMGEVESSTGQRPQDEWQMRRMVLQTLYNVRRNRPFNPGMSLMVVAEVLGSSIEVAQFTLWYLRGKKLIEITNDDGIAITVAGVDWLEADEPQPAPKEPTFPSLIQHMTEVPMRPESGITDSISSDAG
jgi:curved DNA-binding protein CbpA